MSGNVYTDMASRPDLLFLLLDVGGGGGGAVLGWQSIGDDEEGGDGAEARADEEGQADPRPAEVEPALEAPGESRRGDEEGERLHETNSDVERRHVVRLDGGVQYAAQKVAEADAEGEDGERWRA